MARIFVAMSGGVDSSVAAALLVEQGHDVTGVTMQLWPSGDGAGSCCSVSAVRDARRVCDLLGVPHYALNFRTAFQESVVAPFVDEYARGRTPNPCIVCNDAVKFSRLLAKVTAQGADFLATGHYAQIVADDQGVPWLGRAADRSKDQTYFLYRLTRPQMARILFPIGSMRKSDVRAVARRVGLAVADKPDSQEICFASAGQHATVVGERRPEALVAGDVVDVGGRNLGTHTGIANYTVGQRKGLGLGADGPHYVVAIDSEENRVVVGSKADLAVTQVKATSVVWHGEHVARVEAMVRYRMVSQPAKAHVTKDDRGAVLHVAFESPLFGVAPGQAVVCYQGDRVIGGGVIECAN